MMRRLLASVGAFVDTWYPRIESDRDLPYDFAEALADKEAEEEVAEPLVEDIEQIRIFCSEHGIVWTDSWHPDCPECGPIPPVSSLADVRESSEVDAGPEATASPDTPAAESPNSAAGASTCKYCGEPIELHTESYELVRYEIWLHTLCNGLSRIACSTNATPK